MNAELKYGVVPSGLKNYELNIPSARASYFEAHREEILGKVKYTSKTSPMAPLGRAEISLADSVVHRSKLAIALANRLARTAWSVLRGENR